jgi:hypothetical protein
MGTLLLYLFLKTRGAHIPPALGGLIALWYFMPTQKVKSPRLCALAIIVIVSAVVALATAPMANRILGAHAERDGQQKEAGRQNGLSNGRL